MTKIKIQAKTRGFFVNLLDIFLIMMLEIVKLYMKFKLIIYITIHSFSSFPEILVFHMVFIKGFCVWLIRTSHFCRPKDLFITIRWNLLLMIFFIGWFFVELFCSLRKIRIIKRVNLSLRLYSLIIGKIVCSCNIVILEILQSQSMTE